MPPKVSDTGNQQLILYDSSQEKNYEPIASGSDLGHDTIILLRINDEILNTGKFLQNAIAHMYYFGDFNNHMHYPTPWLDRPNGEKSQCRYVNPDILKERLSMINNNDTAIDTPVCLWSEHERARIINQNHKKGISYNIDKFLVNGMSQELINMASDTRFKINHDCKHLPMLWSVINVRIPNLRPAIVRVYADPEYYETNENITENMIFLIQSRYMINVAIYKEGSPLKVLNEQIFKLENALKFPLFIVVPESGDIFLAMEKDIDLISFYNKKDSDATSELGHKVIDCIKEKYVWWTGHQENDSEFKTKTKVIHGLLSREVTSIIFDLDTSTKTPLALELLCHALVEINPNVNDNFNVEEFNDQLSANLKTFLQECQELNDLNDVYSARIWWAITRGELGEQTDEMTNYNSGRSIANVKRSAWNYEARYKISQSFTEYNWVLQGDVHYLLDDFYDSDAITFSTNTVVKKKDVLDLIHHPLSCEGTPTSIIQTRIDSLNRKYSDNVGPRLYSQLELDYMMTNVKANVQRKKLTQRLYQKGAVYFLLVFLVSPEASERHGAESHSLLCKVRYVKKKTGSRKSSKHELVIEWLEGSFKDTYKLCAVPILTYLSLYFGAEVRQVAFVQEDTLELDSKLPFCSTIALHAANQRMQRDIKNNRKIGVVPETAIMTEADMIDFRSVLLFSMFLMTLKEN